MPPIIDPTIGLISWHCYVCGAIKRIGGDVGDDRGWQDMRDHQKSHRKEKGTT